MFCAVNGTEISITRDLKVIRWRGGLLRAAATSTWKGRSADRLTHSLCWALMKADSKYVPYTLECMCWVSDVEEKQSSQRVREPAKNAQNEVWKPLKKPQNQIFCSQIFSFICA